MRFAISGIGAFIDCLVLFFFYFRIRKNMVKDNNFFYFFERFTLFSGLFYLCFSIPIMLVPENSFSIGLGYLVGHVFMYIAAAYLARIWWLIVKPSLDSKIIFRIYLAMGALITALNIFFFNYPNVLENGITEWNQKPLVGTMIIIFGMSAFLPAAVLFIIESFRVPQQRIRYAIIGISFFLLIASGPLHDVAKTPNMSLVADIVTTFAYGLMLLGVLSTSKSVLSNKKS